jgi:hypothetical protein
MMHATQAAQSAAVGAREAVERLLELERRRARPAVLQWAQLTQARPLVEVQDVDGSAGVTIANTQDNAANVHVGFGGRSAAGSGIGLGVNQWVSLPVAAGAIEIGADAAVGVTFEVLVLRHFFPPPFFAWV